MSETSAGETSWFDDATEAVGAAYEATVEVVEDGYGAAASTVEEAYTYGASTVEQAYSYGASAVEQAYEWGVDAPQQPDVWLYNRKRVAAEEAEQRQRAIDEARANLGPLSCGQGPCPTCEAERFVVAGCVLDPSHDGSHQCAEGDGF
jgi:hypothetical protein